MCWLLQVGKVRNVGTLTWVPLLLALIFDQTCADVICRTKGADLLLTR